MNPDVTQPRRSTQLVEWIREHANHGVEAFLVGLDQRLRSIRSIDDRSHRARQFASFGPGATVAADTCIVNPASIHLGAGAVVAAGTTLSAGWSGTEPGLTSVTVRLGDRSLLGAGSSLVAHREIVLGDDVWTGRNVHLVDMNHDYCDAERPISVQWQGPESIHIGAGSWLGHGVVVLPGARIGAQVVVGANSVVAGSLPDRCVAVGAPARIVRRHDPEQGWLSVDRDGTTRPEDPRLPQITRLLAELGDAPEAALAEIEALTAELDAATDAHLSGSA